MGNFFKPLLRYEALKSVEVYSPYHCPNCHFIWDSVEQFNDHKNLCFSDPESLKITALLLSIPYYNPENPNVFPKNRCGKIMNFGKRKGKICLRKVLTGTKKCYIHTKPNN